MKESRATVTNHQDVPADINARLRQPITLVGIMGAGKSHIGHELAGALGLKFYDSDKLVEDKAGQSIGDIFENFGEDKFRSAEQNTITELLKKGPCIVATGGGALTNAQTLEALKQGSLMVWLDADLETLWERVQKSQTRPLLQTGQPKEKLQALLSERQPLYAQAHIHFKINAQSQQKASESLIKTLYEYLNEDSV